MIRISRRHFGSLIGGLVGATAMSALNFERSIAGGTWSAGAYEVTVKWGERWESKKDVAVDKSYRLVLQSVIEPQIACEFVVWELETTDPWLILDEFSLNYRETAVDLEIQQQFSVGASRVMPQIVTFTDTTGVRVKNFLTPSPLQVGGSLVQVIAYPEQFEPQRLKESHEDLSITYVWGSMDVVKGAPAPTPSALPEFTPSLCRSITKWTENAGGWLTAIESAISILEGYEDMNPYPGPYVKYGLINAYDDMSQLGEVLSDNEHPDVVKSIHSRISSLVNSVLFGASSINGFLRTSPVNVAQINETVNRVEELRPEIEAIRGELAKIEEQCT